MTFFIATSNAANLPDGRGYELVSPGNKGGNDIIGETSRIHTSTGESPGLFAAITFASFGAFGDVNGTGVATEYLAQRDATPGTQGWTTHGITPRQEPLSFMAASEGQEPLYVGEMSADLTKGVFRAWSPLTSAPNVGGVVNLYARNDLRSEGAGAYQLLTDAVAPLPALAPRFGSQATLQRPTIAGASSDYRHVLFETNLNLTADASGSNVKVYKADGGVVRLVADGSGVCPGGTTPSGPCAIAGLGAAGGLRTPNVVSSDGTRVDFSAPVRSGSIPIGTTAAGIATRLYQLDDQGTPATQDDALIELSASEKSAPDATQAASYQTASTDGSRVFFLSNEQLTDTPSSGLYMWERKSANETQSVTVDATGGSFTLTAHAQPSAGTGTLTNGSTAVTGVTGSFSVGQTISGPGIVPGTTIVAAAPGSLTLSAPATADGDSTLSASVDATTNPLPFDATTADVQSALESLSVIGTGNVTVSGSPQAYDVTFTGALAGVDVRQMTADGSALTGGARTAIVATRTPVHNLTFIAPSVLGVTGASEDGHRVYFPAGGGQLVPGAPALPEDGLYLWQDASGSPSLSFIGGLTATAASVLTNRQWTVTPFLGRVTPDGRHLAFESGDGSGLRPGYQHGNCGLPCEELYVYSADTSTPTNPDVVCASCNLAVPQAPFETQIDASQGVGATQRTPHLNRNISDDGTHVFFSTAEPLVPEDVNNRMDAYEYDVPSRTVHLISSGTDPSDSFFMDVSGDGLNAYFLTRQQLVGWDRDGAYDLYDARIGGGFPDPPVPPTACVGDACQGQSPSPPAAALVGSSVFKGLGDLPPAKHAKKPQRARRCKRGRVKKRVHGKVRCVKRKSTRRTR